MAVQVRQRMTAAAFDEWVMLPENAEQSYEFIGGEVVEVVSHSYSSYIAARFLIKIGVFVEAHELGYVTGADGGYKVGEERYLPDVGFISNMRQPEIPNEVYIPQSPDLAVEVVSPTDKERTLLVKISNYLAASTTVWVVYPDEREVHIHQTGKTVQIMGVGDTLSGGEVLPGFELAVSDIFPKE